MHVLAHIEAPSTDKGYDICNLSWSPHGRYLSFEPYCNYSAGIPYKEVYLWDTIQNSVQQITTYTNPHPDTWTTYPQEKFAVYTPFWYDRQTLMLGVQSVALIADKNKLVIDPKALTVRTELYRFDSTKPTILFDEAVTAWAKNPVSNQIAFRKQNWIVNTNGDKERTQDEVDIATFDGQTLKILASASGGCDDLKWSPDGAFLSYSVLKDVSYDNNCNLYPALGSVRFFTERGQKEEYQLPDSLVARIGWLHVPDVATPTTAFFPQGTPTAIPTVSGYG
jgi:Tol biopolymer transport system component